MIRNFLFYILIFTGFAFPQDKNIAVTVDDLPFVLRSNDSTEYISLTKKLLAHLDKYGIEAVGFVNEGKLYINNNIKDLRLNALRLWMENGQELGNHTYSHYSLNRIPAASFIEDIKEGETVIRAIMKEFGKKLRYFRHPYLHTGRSIESRDSVYKFLCSSNYQIAPVSIDNSEWIFALAYDNAFRDKDTASMNLIISEYIPYMLEKIKYFEVQSAALFDYNINHILLIHANRLNADAGDLLFQAIADFGYNFISLEEALKDSAYESQDSFTGAAGISWLHRWAITKGKSKEFFSGENKVPEKILELSGVRSE